MNPEQFLFEPPAGLSSLLKQVQEKQLHQHSRSDLFQQFFFVEQETKVPLEAQQSLERAVREAILNELGLHIKTSTKQEFYLAIISEQQMDRLRNQFEQEEHFLAVVMTWLAELSLIEKALAICEFLEVNERTKTLHSHPEPLQLLNASFTEELPENYLLQSFSEFSSFMEEGSTQ